jgi:hypothetical protein
MVVKTEPMPYMKGAFQYGARSAREEALLGGLQKIDNQVKMNAQHTGGNKVVTVPQFHTGMNQGPMNPNALSAKLNEALTQHAANSEFDKLALSNSVKKGGARKKRRTNKKRRSMKRKTIKRKTNK